MIIKLGLFVIIFGFSLLNILNDSNFVNIVKIQEYRLNLDRDGMWQNGLIRSVNTGPNARFEDVLNEISNIQTGISSIWSNNFIIVYVIPHNAEKVLGIMDVDTRDLHDFILLRDDNSYWICVLNVPKKLNPDGSLSWWNRFIKIK